MSGVIDLAVMIKNRDNLPQYSPMTGKIISLPELKIQLGDRTFLYEDDVSSIFNIYETKELGEHREYVNINKEIVLLPCYNNKGYIKSFIAIGVLV